MTSVPEQPRHEIPPAIQPAAVAPVVALAT